MPDCVSCAIFEKFDTLAQAYGRQAFDLLAPSTHLAFNAFVGEGVFKLLAVTAIAPLLIAAAAFKPSRGFAVAGFRIVLGGVLTVIFAAVAMGFTLSVMRFFLDQLPMNENGFATAVSDW